MEYLQNISISEFSKIKLNFLSNMLTAMLCVNAVAITVTVGILEGGLEYPKNVGVGLCIFSSALAVLLFFILKRYFSSLSFRFYRIEQERMESISKSARYYFFPLLVCMSINTVCALLGASVLLLSLASQLN